MCGIVGAVSKRNVVPMLIEGLSRLEYRGYDSAGIAVLNGTGTDSNIRRVRAVGRVAEMQNKANAESLTGLVGIGHTRWATHGGVTESNAHPHVSCGEIAVVHNGIIENHDEQRSRLTGLGYEFESQTDTEVIAHLIHYYRASGQHLLACHTKSRSRIDRRLCHQRDLYRRSPDRHDLRPPWLPFADWLRRRRELYRFRRFCRAVRHAPGDLSLKMAMLPRFAAKA